MARIALRARFQKIWIIWSRSATNRTDSGTSSRSIWWRLVTSSECRSSSTFSRSASPMSNSTSERSPGRAKRRKPLMVRSSRRLSLRMISSRRWALVEGGTLADRSWTEPEIAASGLPISCASPAESSPMAAMRSLIRTCCSSCSQWVTSWKMKMKPRVVPSRW